MTHPFKHPASKSLFVLIRKIFEKKLIFQNKEGHIIFVCGGKVRHYSRTQRYRFIKFASKYTKQFRTFIAEAATEDLLNDDEPEFNNIADFESIIASLADCILIFPESEGSISEISYFSNDENIAKKILVANDINEQGDSFINLGPINKIDKISIFQPTIRIDFDSHKFDVIKERLHIRLTRSKSKRFHFNKFSNLNPKERLSIIFQIVYIFKILTIDGIFFCIEEIFSGEVDKREIRHILSFLIAVKYLRRVKKDSAYFTPNRNIDPFLEIRNYDISNLQAMTAFYFSKYHKESYDLLEKI